MHLLLRTSLMAAALVTAAFATPAQATTPTPAATPPLQGAQVTGPPSRQDSFYIDPRRIAADPDKYAADYDDPDAPYFNINLRGVIGAVEQHEDFTWFAFRAQVQSANVTEQFVVVTPRNENLLRGTQVCLYAIPWGTDSATYSTTGVTAEFPLLVAYEIKTMYGENTGTCPRV